MVALGRLGALTPAGVSLDLNPLTGLAMVSGVKSSLEDAITFARAGTAWDYDVGGLLRQAAAGMPRLSYHPHSGLPLGLLIEPPSADLWDRTEDFENDAWTKTGLQLYVGSVSGLDGRSIGTRMVDTGSSRGLITRNIAVGSGDAAYSAAFTARAIPGGVRSIEATIHFHGGSGNQGGSAVYDLLLGKVVSGTGASCGMVPAPFGAWRCILAACNTHGHTGITVGLGRWARDPDNGYDVLSISMEAREEATSPMRSGAGLSTRAAGRHPSPWATGSTRSRAPSSPSSSPTAARIRISRCSPCAVRAAHSWG
ncbi:hypothetical protein M446_0203 [Methylobacterium sp. 4-46]|uniref:phage head spike fiber domain-containing protein n=1 Tax=unclassified Methylobacterium TaxID=2615210 RepID=UPI000165C8CE|nr:MULTISPECIES: hypothetical protein [Methylobacterium]ACA14777.1 hypothetical protein M446_0203 [Methylobacterium sp. 4-46]WFT80527.1 hypothetical protein QA634_01030 [Methylobacterium nodulans]